MHGRLVGVWMGVQMDWCVDGLVCRWIGVDGWVYGWVGI